MQTDLIELIDRPDIDRDGVKLWKTDQVDDAGRSLYRAECDGMRFDAWLKQIQPGTTKAISKLVALCVEGGGWILIYRSGEGAKCTFASPWREPFDMMAGDLKKALERRSNPFGEPDFMPDPINKDGVKLSPTTEIDSEGRRRWVAECNGMRFDAWLGKTLPQTTRSISKLVALCADSGGWIVVYRGGKHAKCTFASPWCAPLDMMATNLNGSLERGGNPFGDPDFMPANIDRDGVILKPTAEIDSEGQRLWRAECGDRRFDAWLGKIQPSTTKAIAQLVEFCWQHGGWVVVYRSGRNAKCTFAGRGGEFEVEAKTLKGSIAAGAQPFWSAKDWHRSIDPTGSVTFENMPLLSSSGFLRWAKTAREAVEFSNSQSDMTLIHWPGADDLSIWRSPDGERFRITWGHLNRAIAKGAAPWTISNSEFGLLPADMRPAGGSSLWEIMSGDPAPLPEGYPGEGLFWRVPLSCGVLWVRSTGDQEGLALVSGIRTTHAIAATREWSEIVYEDSTEVFGLCHSGDGDPRWSEGQRVGAITGRGSACNCAVCTQGKSSAPMRQIAKWTKERWPRLTVMADCPDHRSQERTIFFENGVHALQLDLYIPEIDFALEYSGAFYHFRPSNTRKKSLRDSTRKGNTLEDATLNDTLKMMRKRESVTHFLEVIDNDFDGKNKDELHHQFETRIVPAIENAIENAPDKPLVTLDERVQLPDQLKSLDAFKAGPAKIAGNEGLTVLFLAMLAVRAQAGDPESSAVLDRINSGKI